MRNNKKVGTKDSIPAKSIRLLPGVIIVALQWLARFALPAIVPGTAEIGVLTGLAGGLAILIWWAFFSGAQRADRLGGVVLMILAIIGASLVADESIRTGMQGMMFFVFVIPVLSLAFVAWAVASRNLPVRPRRIGMVATILLACGAWTLLRSDGIDGYAGAFFKWRWSETTEERFLSRFGDETGQVQALQGLSGAEVDWPGFRGANRDAVVPAVQIETDWSAIHRLNCGAVPLVRGVLPSL